MAEGNKEALLVRYSREAMAALSQAATILRNQAVLPGQPLGQVQEYERMVTALEAKVRAGNATRIVFSRPWSGRGG